MKPTDPSAAPAAWLLRGHVMHERLSPVRHRFTYPLFQISCDVARMNTLASWWFAADRHRLLSVKSTDYGPRDGRSLDAWMRERLAASGIPADGAIWLQTIPRIVGYAFNPVSFWYCHDREGNLRAIYADVNNTFGQHHGYLLCSPDTAAIRGDVALECRKVFHVSPFCKVEGEYAFRVNRHGRWWSVGIDYRVDDRLLLRTVVGMRAEPFTGVGVLKAMLRGPFDALNVVFRIHWQALRLLLKRVPFHGKSPLDRYVDMPTPGAACERELPPAATPSDQEIRS
ncbi:cyclopropane fatty acid synthase [Pandoraea anapnoica]|uniref:Cyclopropane fatty acid synthase n=1 Tax=Pandoraea anapnoica TaxID=2508301 RepID=A0A5E4ZWT8_9BURK|nr:DUF1365 domain-containing protein [Pandoraea anapnoica]VVE65278.1 cyclopropane fatty acid synthase [Pandoraea anapnoica]